MEVLEYLYQHFYYNLVAGNEIEECSQEMNNLFQKYGLKTRINIIFVICEVGDRTFELVKDNNDVITNEFLVEFYNKFCMWSQISLEGFLEENSKLKTITTKIRLEYTNEYWIQAVIPKLK